MGRGGKTLTAKRRHLDVSDALDQHAPTTYASGISVHAQPITPLVTVIWTLLFAPLVVLLTPLLFAYAVVNTAFEVMNYLHRGPEEGDVIDLGGAKKRSPRAPSSSPQSSVASAPLSRRVDLVLPGTGNNVFFQMGMVQWIAETFDTRACRLLGVSSGAVCATLLLALERAAEKEPGGGRDAARARAEIVYRAVEERVGPLCAAHGPLGFAGRIGGAIDDLVRALFDDDVASHSDLSRVYLGVRRLRWNAASSLLPPTLAPTAVCGFGGRRALVDAVRASTTLPAVVAAAPLRRLSGVGWCMDGLLPCVAHRVLISPPVYKYSLWAVLEYAWDLRRRPARAACAAPPHTFNVADDAAGGRDTLGLYPRLHALWNAPIVRALIRAAAQRDDRRREDGVARRPREDDDQDHDHDHAPPLLVWVTPTVGGEFEMAHMLNWSAEYTAKLWERGYRHARDLDRSRAYWSSLEQWRRL